MRSKTMGRIVHFRPRLLGHGHRKPAVPKLPSLPAPEPFTADEHARWAAYGKALDASKALPHLNMSSPWVRQNLKELDLLPKVDRKRKLRPKPGARAPPVRGPRSKRTAPNDSEDTGPSYKTSQPLGAPPTPRDTSRRG